LYFFAITFCGEIKLCITGKNFCFLLTIRCLLWSAYIMLSLLAKQTYCLIVFYSFIEFCSNAVAECSYQPFCWVKKQYIRPTIPCPLLREMLIHFQNSYTSGHSNKCSIKSCLNIPPHPIDMLLRYLVNIYVHASAGNLNVSQSCFTDWISLSSAQVSI